MKQPILYCVFNRFETIKQTFKPIIEYQPSKLYIASDGARENVSGEKELIKEIRNFLLLSVYWDCEVHTLFQDNNLGCDHQMSVASDWFFKNEEMGIIIEDDIVATKQFFNFCSQMLEKYRYDDKISCISGLCDVNNINISYPYDYIFSNNIHFWGWAAWRRSFNDFDIKVRDWNIIKNNRQFKNAFISKFTKLNFYNEMETLKLNCPWDLAFKYLNYKNFAFNGKLCIMPTNKRLTTNIGFDGTHAVKEFNSHLGWLPDKLNCDSLKHPPSTEFSYDYILQLEHLHLNVAVNKYAANIFKLLFINLVFLMRFVSQILKLIFALFNKEKRQHRLCRLSHLKYNAIIYNYVAFKKMTGD